MADETKMESAGGRGDGGRGETGSLLRGLALVEVLQSAQRPLTATELAEAVGQSVSTVHRLLQTLVQSEYAYRDSSKRYLASPKTYMPLSLYHPLNTLRRDAREHVRTLRDQFRQTSSIILFLGVQRLVVEMAVENESLSPYHATQLKSPLHGAASGKVLLASLTPKARADLLGPGPYPAVAPNTITDAKAMEAEMKKVQAQGFATAVDENYLGLTAVAAPIHAGPNHVIGCFDVAGLSKTFSPEDAQAAGTVVRMTAELFSMGSSAVKAVAAFANPATAEILPGD